MAVKILHLYHDIMNLYGDYGNIVILKKHLEDQGLHVIVEEKTLGNEFRLRDYDFVYIGSGTERNLDAVLEDLRMHLEEIKEYIENDGILLATGNSFEMFGSKIDDQDALKIFDFEVKRDDDRTTSDVIYESEYFHNKIVGFINMQTKMYHNMNPLFKVIFGVGENEKNDYEGVKYKNFYGTHVSGPIFARNPEFLEEFVIKIGKKQDSNFKIKSVRYSNEEEGYELVLRELTQRNERKKEEKK